MASVCDVIVQSFLAVAASAEALIASDRVAERWEQPSVLDGYRVAGLVGHLARAVLTVAHYLDEPAPSGALKPIDAAGYFVRVLASHDPVDSDFHQRVRERGEREAAEGQAALVARLGRTRKELAERLTSVEPGRTVAALDDAVLTVEQYLETRLVELVVHLDDLAVSVGLDGPDEIPDEAYELVAAVLARVAARRAGPLATVRSFARRERHPDAVRAL